MTEACPNCGTALEAAMLVNGLCPACLARSMKAGLLGLLDEAASTVEAAPLQIDGYEIHELIGGGGMGEVYRALHLETREVVAVKVVCGEPNMSAGNLVVSMALMKVSVVRFGPAALSAWRSTGGSNHGPAGSRRSRGS